MVLVTVRDMATNHLLTAQVKMDGNRIILAERLRQTKILVVTAHTKTDNPISRSICGSEQRKLAFDDIIVL